MNKPECEHMFADYDNYKTCMKCHFIVKQRFNEVTQEWESDDE